MLSRYVCGMRASSIDFATSNRCGYTFWDKTLVAQTLIFRLRASILRARSANAKKKRLIAPYCLPSEGRQAIGEDEQGGKALATPRSNVKTLRELFSDKDARCMPHVASLKKREGPTEVRIPRPSLTPKPSNNRKLSLGPAKESSAEPSSPAGQSSLSGSLPRVGGVSTRRASFEHGRVAIVQQTELLPPSPEVVTAEVSSSRLSCEDFPLPQALHMVAGDRSPASEKLCCDASSLSEEEDYVTPISLSSKPLEAGCQGSVVPSRQWSEEALPRPPKSPEGSSPKVKPKLPEPPLYVPPQLVRHPVAPGWQRRELPVAATACPPKPARPSGMCLLTYSSLHNVAPIAAQPDRPSLAKRSTPPVPPSRAPPPRPLVPKPPRLLPSLPTTPADDTCSEPRQPTSPIPEYTEDEELGNMAADEELYADTEMDETPPSLPPARTPPAPPRPPDDELYQDTLEELYEEMPTDETASALPPPIKVLDILPRQDKRDSVCKAFGLPSGWEQLRPLDVGRARASSSGGTKNLDLPLHCGEPVYVLRFENNPPGKWLVRNHKGEDYDIAQKPMRKLEEATSKCCAE
ncbi:uncharacterized protein LOC142559751 isoform X4 [Dermacentor variabilis]|uniref:uncharacterized protein LOC142559751 isoform X4 n=1 Tax=Dermacentor variabilis TaxID=34621 RepID=UPI003F5C4729